MKNKSLHSRKYLTLFTFDFYLIMLSSRTSNVSVAATSVASASVSTASVCVLQDNPTKDGSSVVENGNNIVTLDKSEINEAVTKVLQGYDWTLVPIASK